METMQIVERIISGCRTGDTNFCTSSNQLQRGRKMISKQRPSRFHCEKLWRTICARGGSPSRWRKIYFGAERRWRDGQEEKAEGILKTSDARSHFHDRPRTWAVRCGNRQSPELRHCCGGGVRRKARHQ